MRLILITLTFLTIFLFAARAHALPAGSGDDVDKQGSDRGLLTQIDHVRQSVSNRASDLVVNAMGFLGVPYKRGGTSAETGFDCSGFVRAMYEQSIGLILPRRAEQQAAATQNIDKKDLQPGDLVFFNTMRRAFSHVGIYVGDGKFIHSPRTGSEVKVESMSQSYWTRRFDGARRVTTKTVDGTGNSSSALPVQLPAFAVQQMQVQTSSSVLLQPQKQQQDQQLYSR